MGSARKEACCRRQLGPGTRTGPSCSRARPDPVGGARPREQVVPLALAGALPESEGGPTLGWTASAVCWGSEAGDG